MGRGGERERERERERDRKDYTEQYVCRVYLLCTLYLIQALGDSENILLCAGGADIKLHLFCIDGDDIYKYSSGAGGAEKKKENKIH